MILDGPWESTFAFRPCGAGWLLPPSRTPRHEERMMSHYTIEELIARWKREELTVEQMIGQMLQVLREQERRVRELARFVASGKSNMPERGRDEL